MKEVELLKRCLDNDKKAWGLFVEKYSNLVYWAIRKRLSCSAFQYNQSDIDDFFQEVFVAILEGQKLAQIRDVKFIPGWLAMFASNKTVDFMRQKARLNESLGLNEAIFKDSGEDDDLLSRDMVSLVKEVINSLSDKERIIISLNLLEGKKHQEICKMLNIPINTVSTIISRTKQKLAKSLEKMGIGDYLQNI